MKNIISQVLVSKQMSQTQLAKEIGLRPEYLNRIINDHVTPTLPLGIKIAHALGKKVEEVFC